MQTDPRAPFRPTCADGRSPDATAAMFEAALDSSLPQLRRRARRQLATWPLAGIDHEDLVQEAVVRTLRRLGNLRFDSIPASVGYVTRALDTATLDTRRRAVRRPATEALSEHVPATLPSPIERLLRHEQRERCRQALSRLAPDLRRAVYLRVVEGWDFARLAALLGKSSPDAARVALRRALGRAGRPAARRVRPSGRAARHVSGFRSGPVSA